MSDIKWIKIVTDIFDDEKILLIESLPSYDSIIVIWFKLLCLAGKQNNNGVFLLNGRIPYTESMLATIFRRDESIVRLALETFEQFGMIEIVDNVITIPNWEKHQSTDKLDSIRENTRLRVQRYRDKQKALACNVTETLCNDTEEDKEKDKKKKRKDAIGEFTENEDLKTAINEFIKMRKVIKKPMTDRALTLMLNKLSQLSSDETEQIEILNQSIEHNWQTVYPIKEKTEQKVERDVSSHDWDYDALQRLAEERSLR